MYDLMKLCVLCRVEIPALQEDQLCGTCRNGHPIREDNESMATRKKTARKPARRPRKPARTNNRGNGAAARDDVDEVEDDDDETSDDDDESEGRQRRPRTPKQIIERASMFATCETVDEQDRIFDLFYDQGSAEIVAGVVDGAFVDPVEVLLIKTKVPGTRGKFDVEAYVLDRAAEQPTRPESSRSASAALVRKRALAKLTDEERAALGFEGIVLDDEPARPRRPRAAASNERGTASNPNTPDVDDDDVDDEHTDDDLAPDPFA